LVFPCLSFHWCSITRENGKKLIIFIIFITELRNKPEGCGGSVASAAGPSPQGGKEKDLNVGKKVKNSNRFNIIIKTFNTVFPKWDTRRGQ
jgi:hypothetical protein